MDKETDLKDKDNLAEFIGQIIDIFEDSLTDRNISSSSEAVIPLHFEDEDSKGVFFGGSHYDNVAEALKSQLTAWKII